MSQYLRSQLRSGALGDVDYLNPDPSYAAHWVGGGNCVSNKTGAKVDPDACEGEYAGWYAAQQAVARAKAAGVAPPVSYKKAPQPAWMLPAVIVGIGLLGILVLRK